MELQSQFPVGLLDLVGGSFVLDSQDFVRVKSDHLSVLGTDEVRAGSHHNDDRDQEEELEAEGARQEVGSVFLSVVGDLRLEDARLLEFSIWLALERADVDEDGDG